MDTFVYSLQQKEKELRIQLEESDLFKKWMQLKQTIEMFTIPPQKEVTTDLFGHPVPNFQAADPIVVQRSTQKYDNERMTWKEKILFALNELKEGTVTDIVNCLKKHGAKEDDEFLNKRVGVTVSTMKVADGVIDARMDGKRGVYFIK